MRNRVARTLFVVAGSLLPTAILLSLLQGHPIWAGLVSWAIVGTVMVLLGLAIRRRQQPPH